MDKLKVLSVNRYSKRGRYERHGMSTYPEYATWCAINERCHNSNNPSYRLYGGMGVKVYAGWRHSFSAFFKYIGRKPSPKHGIDRWPDPFGGYVPGNVRWATAKQQCRNLRTNKRYTFRGKTQCLVEWSEELGINLHTLHTRLHYDGQSVEEAFTSAKARKTYTVRGRSMKMAEWSKVTGIKLQTISNRIHIYGMTMLEAITKPVRPRK